ncbi:hypothetical protein [Saccharothrix sp. Mg75]|uniref:hypothetical protein n=1 Tax=Saccharothrix sp. Mg75 TaxID=3445357 RepID=UPI003EE9C990
MHLTTRVLSGAALLLALGLAGGPAALADPEGGAPVSAGQTEDQTPTSEPGSELDPPTSEPGSGPPVPDLPTSEPGGDLLEQSPAGSGTIEPGGTLAPPPPPTVVSGDRPVTSPNASAGGTSPSLRAAARPTTPTPALTTTPKAAAPVAGAPPAGPRAGVRGSAPLARTGADAVPPLLASLVLIGAGTALVVAARPRRRS